MSPPDLAIASGRCKASVFGESENILEGFARELSIITDLSAQRQL
jgi:hypothetical protein